MSSSLTIAVVGAGGAGVISVGELLLQAWARSGGLGMLRKAFGPQIRGGEAAALVKLTENESYTAARHYDVLLALDWDNFSRFEDEIRISAETLVLCQAEDVPAQVSAAGSTLLQIDFSGLASEAHPEGRPNMIALGLLGSALGLAVEDLSELAVGKLSRKAREYQDAAAACVAAGAAQELPLALTSPARVARDSWYLSGNQAAGFGALHAGIRFAAAYPITPATDALEWMAGGLEKTGGHLVQAEDELAAINMIIGAAFGGVPAMTATSGPGLALMTESIGLAVASETPITILNVMRGGPSTGIPTKSEQSDLDIALHGLHGDAPHLVLAPLDIADCAFTTSWAVSLAQQLQTAAIVLSDQFIGQSTAAVSAPRLFSRQPDPVSEAGAEELDYLRYRLTDSGISTLAFPGDADQRFTADGLEHDEQGAPSARASDHLLQLEKRRSKLLQCDFGSDWAKIDGQGEIALLGFGSASLAMDEAAQALRERGLQLRTIALRLLMPLQAEALREALAGCERVLIVEQNHGAQLYRYLRSLVDFEQPLASLAIPGPVPLNSEQIAAAVEERL